MTPLLAAPASASVSDGASPDVVTPSGPVAGRAAPMAVDAPGPHPSPTSAADASSDPDDAPMAPAEALNWPFSFSGTGSRLGGTEVFIPGSALLRLHRHRILLG